MAPASEPPRSDDPGGWPAPAGAGDIMLFGGTFDPPHKAHVELADRAREWAAGSGAWLVFVPAARSPFKDEAPTPETDRLEMLRLAIRALDRAAIWSDELDRARTSPGPSYWIDTLRRARAQAPGARLYFLIGADQAAEFHRWREARAILDIASPIVLLREPWADPAALIAAMRLAGFWSERELEAWRARIAPIPLLTARATDARRLIREAGPESPPLRDVLDAAVIDYIAARGLYCSAGPD